MSDDENWVEWLDEDYGQYLEQIRSKVKNLYALEKEKPLAYYTPHGPTHCLAVENYLHRLIPGKIILTNLKQQERFYLLAAAWLHDLGMLRSIAEQYLPRPTSDEEIRQNHHTTSEKFIIDNYDKCGLKYSINSINQFEDREILGKICRWHRKQEDINNVPKTQSIRCGEEYRVQLLAAYLRLADALHIDSSRAPDFAYSICLAYDIPSETKMHWIKSHLVPGVTIDSKQHKITVEFRLPREDQLKDKKVNDEWVMNKINIIIDDVMEHLREELASVMFVLANGGLTYYLEIEKKIVYSYIPDDTLTDILSMVTDYDILTSPSSSTLVEMVLRSVSNMAGYHLNENQNPFNFDNSRTQNKISKEIAHFIEKLKQDVFKKRSCHYGVIALVNKIETIMQECLPQKLPLFIEKINGIFQSHFKLKNTIYSVSSEYFSNIRTKLNRKETLSILLYGYSDLVIKSLCAFKKALNKNENLNFEFYICEGRPKTQIMASDKIIYNDGFSYALELKKNNFTNIKIIPDIVVGNVIENHNIDLIMVGANGFSKEFFEHSAGHTSILEVAWAYRTRSHNSFPKIVLVVSTDKYLSEPKPVNNQQSEQIIAVNKYFFWKPKNVNVRQHLWFYPCEEIEKYEQNILFYNPIDDKVPIEYLDYIISNVGYFEIFSENKDNIEKNKQRFFSAIENLKLPNNS